jgi:hypothetical protein
MSSKEIAKDICGVGPWRFYKRGTEDPYSGSMEVQSEKIYLKETKNYIDGTTNSIDAVFGNDGDKKISTIKIDFK